MTSGFDLPCFDELCLNVSKPRAEQRKLLLNSSTVTQDSVTLPVISRPQMQSTGPRPIPPQQTLPAPTATEPRPTKRRSIAFPTTTNTIGDCSGDECSKLELLLSSMQYKDKNLLTSVTTALQPSRHGLSRNECDNPIHRPFNNGEFSIGRRPPNSEGDTPSMRRPSNDGESTSTRRLSNSECDAPIRRPSNNGESTCVRRLSNSQGDKPSIRRPSNNGESISKRRIHDSEGDLHTRRPSNTGQSSSTRRISNSECDIPICRPFNNGEFTASTRRLPICEDDTPIPRPPNNGESTTLPRPFNSEGDTPSIRRPSNNGLSSTRRLSNSECDAPIRRPSNNGEESTCVRRLSNSQPGDAPSMHRPSNSGASSSTRKIYDGEGDLPMRRLSNNGQSTASRRPSNNGQSTTMYRPSNAGESMTTCTSGNGDSSTAQTRTSINEGDMHMPADFAQRRSSIDRSANIERPNCNSASDGTPAFNTERPLRRSSGDGPCRRMLTEGGLDSGLSKKRTSTEATPRTCLHRPAIEYVASSPSHVCTRMVETFRDGNPQRADANPTRNHQATRESCEHGGPLGQRLPAVCTPRKASLELEKEEKSRNKFDEDKTRALHRGRHSEKSSRFKNSLHMTTTSATSMVHDPGFVHQMTAEELETKEKKKLPKKDEKGRLRSWVKAKEICDMSSLIEQQAAAIRGLPAALDPKEKTALAEVGRRNGFRSLFF